MKKALPLILVAGGAALFMGGKKKKTTTSAPAPEEEEPPVTGDDEETDEGDGPETEDDGYGKVANGVRKDRIGSHPWRIMHEEDGFHAQLMTAAGRFAAIQSEIGTAASLKAAKELLRDHFNEAILNAGYSEDDFLDDPASPASRQKFSA